MAGKTDNVAKRPVQSVTAWDGLPEAGSAERMWRERALQEAWEEAERIMAAKEEEQNYTKWQNDPVGFCQTMIGDHYTDDIKKVMESVRDNPITIAKSSTGPGKSHAAARIAIWFYKCFPGSKVFMTAAPPFENLRRILWGELTSVVRKKPELFENDVVMSRNIHVHDQHFIERVAIPTSGTREDRVAKFSGKHAPYLLFIVDEGDAVPDEVYEGIEGCMSGGMVRLLIMFNPKLRAGSVYYKEVTGAANVIKLPAFSHPNVTTGMNVIPGAVDREVTVRRINEWTRPIRPDERADENTFELPDFLVGTIARSTSGEPYPPLEPGVRVIQNPAFSYMVLGEYPALGDAQLISESWISAARSNYDMYVARYGEIPPVGINPVLGLDVAELGNDSNVAALRYGAYVAPFIVWKNVDPDETARRALQVYREKMCSIAMVDGTGVGSACAPAMSRMGRDEGVRAVSIKLANKPLNFIKTELGEFYQLRDQLYWAMREWLRLDKNAMLPPDRALLDELRAPQYQVTLNGKIRITPKDQLRDILKRSPDRADALSLTFAPFRKPTIVRLDTTI